MLDVEVGAVVAWIGFRVGVSPGELIDFLAGIVTLDPAGDDIPYEIPPDLEAGVRVGETEDTSRRDDDWKYPDR